MYNECSICTVLVDLGVFFVLADVFGVPSGFERRSDRITLEWPAVDDDLVLVHSLGHPVEEAGIGRAALVLGVVGGWEACLKLVEAEGAEHPVLNLGAVNSAVAGGEAHDAVALWEHELALMNPQIGLVHDEDGAAVAVHFGSVPSNEVLQRVTFGDDGGSDCPPSGVVLLPDGLVVLDHSEVVSRAATTDGKDESGVALDACLARARRRDAEHLDWILALLHEELVEDGQDSCSLEVGDLKPNELGEARHGPNDPVNQTLLCPRIERRGARLAESIGPLDDLVGGDVLRLLSLVAGLLHVTERLLRQTDQVGHVLEVGDLRHEGGVEDRRLLLVGGGDGVILHAGEGEDLVADDLGLGLCELHPMLIVAADGLGDGGFSVLHHTPPQHLVEVCRLLLGPHLEEVGGLECLRGGLLRRFYLWICDS